MPQTDGAPSGTVEHGESSYSAQWDSLYAAGQQAVDESRGGSDSLASDPAPEAPQATGDAAIELSAGDQRPEAPPPSATGDDGDRKGAPAPSADAAPATDPLANAAPFAYTVNGQAKTIEGAYLVDGEGLYVPLEKVPHFQLLASKADALDTQVRDLQQRHADLERVTTWKSTGPDGKESILSGRDAVQAQRLAMGNLAAEVTAYRQIFTDPMRIASYLMVSADGQSYELNPDAVRMLGLEIENSQNKIGRAVQSQFASFGQTAGASTAQTQPTEPAPTFDARANGATVVDRAIASAADSPSWAAHLSSDDKAFFAAQAHRYVRAATQDDVQVNPALRVGSPVLDPEFVDLLRSRASANQRAAKTQTSTQSAQTFNAGMQAGAQRGKPPAPAPAPAAPAPTGRGAPKARTRPSANDLWAQLTTDARSVVGG